MFHLHFYLKMRTSRYFASRNQMGVNNICCITFLKQIRKLLSKLLVTSQQAFTGSKSIREKLNVVVVLMSLFLTLNIIQTIFESLLLTLNRKKFIWIASSDYETISIYIIFFQIIKRCCQVHLQATSMFEIASIGIFQKEAIFCYFQSMLYEKQLGLLRGISHLPRCF